MPAVGNSREHKYVGHARDVTLYRGVTEKEADKILKHGLTGDQVWATSNRDAARGYANVHSDMAMSNVKTETEAKETSPKLLTMKMNEAEAKNKAWGPDKMGSDYYAFHHKPKIKSIEVEDVNRDA